MGRWSLALTCLSVCFFVSSGHASAAVSITAPSSAEPHNRINPDYLRIMGKAKVRVGKGTVFGACSPSTIKQKMMMEKKAFLRCYKDGFNGGRSNPGTGSIEVKWRISSSGKVENSTTKIIRRTPSKTSGANLSQVASCVKSKVSSWTFKKRPKNTCLVTWPLIFSAPKERKPSR